MIAEERIHITSHLRLGLVRKFGCVLTKRVCLRWSLGALGATTVEMIARVIRFILSHYCWIIRHANVDQFDAYVSRQVISSAVRSILTGLQY